MNDRLTHPFMAVVHVPVWFTHFELIIAILLFLGLILLGKYRPTSLKNQWSIGILYMYKLNKLEYQEWKCWLE